MSTDYPQPPLPPDPFGDPSRVNRENQARLKKGISIGCIVIAAGVLGFITLIAAILALVFGIIRNTDAASFALEKAQTSIELKAQIGEPISMGTFVGGSVNISNGYGRANVTVPVKGPKGAATVHVVGTKEPGQPWQFTEATAIIEANDKRIDLLAPSPGSQK